MPRPKPKLNIALYGTAYLVLFACFYFAWHQLWRKPAKNDELKNIRLFVTNNSRNQEPLAILISSNKEIVYNDTISERFVEAPLHVEPGIQNLKIKIINRGLEKILRAHIGFGDNNYALNITYEYEPPYAEAKKYLMEEAYQYEVARNKSKDTTYWSHYFDEHQYRFPEQPRSMKAEITDYKNMRLDK